LINSPVTDTLPAYVTGVDLDATETISAGESITFTIPATINDDARGVTTTNTAYFSHSSGQSNDTAVLTTVFAAPNIIQDFELPGYTYVEWNVTVGVTDTIVHSGDQAMFMTGTGDWHTGGAKSYNSPRDIAANDMIRFWVYDAVQANTTAFKLVDYNGDTQKTWSDWPDHIGVNPNPETTKDTWVQMCFSLAAYDLVDLSQIESVQFTMFNEGLYYFDELLEHC